MLWSGLGIWAAAGCTCPPKAWQPATRACTSKQQTYSRLSCCVQGLLARLIPVNMQQLGYCARQQVKFYRLCYQARCGGSQVRDNLHLCYQVALQPLAALQLWHHWWLQAVGDKVRLCDRTALILDIFSQRAATREGMLQVSCLLQAGLGPAVAAGKACWSRQK